MFLLLLLVASVVFLAFKWSVQQVLHHHCCGPVCSRPPLPRLLGGCSGYNEFFIERVPWPLALVREDPSYCSQDFGFSVHPSCNSVIREAGGRSVRSWSWVLITCGVISTCPTPMCMYSSKCGHVCATAYVSENNPGCHSWLFPLFDTGLLLIVACLRVAGLCVSGGSLVFPPILL